MWSDLMIFFLGFVCVSVLRNEWYYIFVWQSRKCEKMWETSKKCVFYGIFKNTTKHQKIFFETFFEMQPNTWKHLLFSSIFRKYFYMNRIEPKSFSQAIFYANTKTPHGEKNLLSTKSESFFQAFLFDSHSLWIDKKSTRQEELHLSLCWKQNLFTCMSDIFFAITKNPHGKKNCYMHVIALLFIKVKVFSKLN